MSIALTGISVFFLLRKYITLWTQNLLWDFSYEIASFRTYNFHQAVPQQFGVYAVGIPVVNKIMMICVKHSPSQECGGVTYLVSGLPQLRVV